MGKMERALYRCLMDDIGSLDDGTQLGGVS